MNKLFINQIAIKQLITKDDVINILYTQFLTTKMVFIKALK